MNNNLRQTRVSTNIASSYFLKGFQGEGRILDISVGGVSMEVKQIFVIGDLMRIIFRLPDTDNTEIEFWGIVLSVNGNVLGIKFEEISNSAIDEINRFMGNTLLKLGKSPKEPY